MATKYRDFNLNFIPHPKTGDISTVSDENSVNQSLRNLISMNFNDVPFNSKLGSNVRARLFDLVTSITADTIKSDIKDVIENYEPRVEVVNIKSVADQEGHGINVTLRYRLRTSTSEIVISYFLQRIS